MIIEQIKRLLNQKKNCKKTKDETTNMKILNRHLSRYSYIDSMQRQETVHTYHEVIPKKTEAISLSVLNSFVIFTETEEEIDKPMERSLNVTTWYDVIIPLFKVQSPVYIETNERGEDERIVYRNALMELGKIYEVNFKGEKWALRKNEKNVEFLKFYPDKK